jgi:hypothetical protein
VETKHLGVALGDHRWFVVSNSLLAQLLQSLIGHRAPVGIAHTDEGFKIFLVEEVPTEEMTDLEHVIVDQETGKLPEAIGEFYRPDFTRIDEGLQLIGECARVISALKQPTGDSESRAGGPIRGAAREKTRNQPYFVRDGQGGVKRVESVCLKSFYSDREIEELLNPTEGFNLL